MKSINAVITATMILIASTILMGCEANIPAELNSDDQNLGIETPSLKAVAQLAETVKKDSELLIEHTLEGDRLIAHLYIANPSAQPIQSVQSWISYNPNQLKGVSIDGGDSSFVLVAPYPNEFDSERGLISIGRSNPTAVTNEKIKVADLTFQVITKNPIVLDAYDYQEDLSGHNSANIVVDNQTYNVLKKPNSPLLVVHHEK